MTSPVPTIDHAAPVPIDKSYGPEWPLISYCIKERAGWRCEGSPAYPACRAVHGLVHPVTDSVVVLTVAHLDHDIRNHAPANLRAWCQRCHLTYDAEQHARTAALTRRRVRELAGQYPLVFDEGLVDTGAYGYPERECRVVLVGRAGILDARAPLPHVEPRHPVRY